VDLDILVNKRINFFIGFILILTFSLNAQNGNNNYQYALIEAVKQKNLGNLPGAIELYRMVISENDTVAVAHYELGNLLLLSEDEGNAIKHLERAYNLDPNNSWYFQSYIDGLINERLYEQALEIQEERIKLLDEKPEYLFNLANIFFLQGNTRKAIRTLDIIEKKYGYSKKITMLKANIYENKGKYRKALKELDRVIGYFPESVEFYIIAAELAMKINKEDLAAEYYEKVLKRDSLNIYGLTNLTDYFRKKGDLDKSFFYMNLSFQSNKITYDRKMAIMSYYLSNEKLRNNYPEELLGLLNTLIDKYPEKKEAHYFATDFNIQLNKYNRALQSLYPALDSSVDNYDIWMQGLLLGQAVGNTDTLLNIVNDAIKLFPDSTDLFLIKAMVNYERKDYVKVLEIFKNLDVDNFSKKDDKEQSHILIAESYYALKNYKKADSLFRKIINKNPGNYGVMNNFAYYLSQRNIHLDEAKDLSKKTIIANPKNHVYLDTYAWILFRLKKLDMAKKYIEKAIMNGGDADNDIILHAIEIYEEIGDHEKAKYYYNLINDEIIMQEDY